MAVQEFSGNHTAELFNLVDIAIDSLLEDFIDHFEVAGEICTFETSRKIYVNIKIGDENYRSLLMTVDFDQFFYVFYTDPGEIDPYIRRCCLNVRQFLAE